MIAAVGALLASGWARVSAGAAALAGVALAVGGAYAVARRDGARGEALKAAEEREAEREKADEARVDVDRLGDADVVRELRAKYTRRP